MWQKEQRLNRRGAFAGASPPAGLGGKGAPPPGLLAHMTSSAAQVSAEIPLLAPARRCRTRTKNAERGTPWVEVRLT